MSQLKDMNQDQLIKWINGLPFSVEAKNKIINGIKKCAEDNSDPVTGSDFIEADVEDIKELTGDAIGNKLANSLLNQVNKKKDADFPTNKLPTLNPTDDNDDNDAFTLNLVAQQGGMVKIPNVTKSWTVSRIKAAYLEDQGNCIAADKYRKDAKWDSNEGKVDLLKSGKVMQNGYTLEYYQIKCQLDAVMPLTVLFKCRGGAKEGKYEDNDNEEDQYKVRKLRRKKYKGMIKLSNKPDCIMGYTDKDNIRRAEMPCGCAIASDTMWRYMKALFEKDFKGTKLICPTPTIFAIIFNKNKQNEYIYIICRGINMDQYSGGEIVQVLPNMDGTDIWFYATIKKVLQDMIKVAYTDELPNYNRKLEFIHNNKLDNKVRRYPASLPSIALQPSPEIKSDQCQEIETPHYTDVNDAKIDDSDVGSSLNPMNWKITKMIFGAGDNQQIAKKKKKKPRSWDQKAIINWNHEDVTSWVQSLTSFKKYASNFPVYIDGKELLKIAVDDLALIIPKPLWRKRFMKQLSLAKDKYAVAANLDQNEYENDNDTSATLCSSKRGSLEINGIVGLRNLGNTCYMNTSIQILSQTPYITRYLATRAKMHNGSNNNNGMYPMLDAWTELCDIIYNKTRSKSRGRYSSSSYKTASPSKIRAALGKIDGEFGAGTQDDSSRSLGYMLDALDEEIEQEIKRQKYQNQKKGYKDIVSKDSIKVLRELTDIEIDNAVKQLLLSHNPNGSILRKAFDGIEQTTFKCLECNKIFQQYDTFRIIHLPVISNQITFKNINIVCNNNYYKMPSISVLDFCSIQLLQYHVIDYLLKHKKEQIINYDIATIVISSNGKIKNINNKYKLSQLQDMCSNGQAIFVLISESNNNQNNNKCDLLQLNINMNKKGKLEYKSIKYRKYDPRLTKEILSAENVNDDEKYDHYICYNDIVLSRKELAQKRFESNVCKYNGINLLIVLSIDKACDGYHYNIDKIDKITMKLASKRHNKCNRFDALKKEKLFHNEILREDNSEEMIAEIQPKLDKIQDAMNVFQNKYNIESCIKNGNLFGSFKSISSNCRKLTSLEECINEYESTKMYDDTYAYLCPHCSSQSNNKFVEVRKKIVYSPPILLFHLDRYGKNSKRSYEKVTASMASYHIGQQLLVNYGNQAYKSEILELNAKGMRIRYEIDAQQEWIPKSKYAAKLPSYHSCDNNYYQCNNYRSNKFDHDIDYDLKLKWNKSSNDDKYNYNLYGISNHSGSTEGGHYTATIKCFTNKKWYDISDSYINDGHIRPLSKAADATILAYSRTD